jgi:hypothetical protein
MAKAKRFINFHVSRNSPYYANYFINVSKKWVEENLKSDMYNGPVHIMYATKVKYAVRFVRTDIELWIPKGELRLCR